MNEFVVYVLYSKDHDKIYIGYSSDLINRIQSHNQFGTKGYIRRFRPWVVIYIEFHSDKATAMKREQSLKSARGRVFIRTELLSQD